MCAIETQPATWPKDVTARIVTAFGLRFDDLRATVDVINLPGIHENTKAVCRCCGRSFGTELSRRDAVVDLAAEHARSCMAMPRPNGVEET